jgi:hypothetical protein
MAFADAGDSPATTHAEEAFRSRKGLQIRRFNW